MKQIKLSLIVGLLASSTILSADYMDNVEVSTNVALTSNYVWRGMTQSNNSMAVQAGVDVGYKGLYIGAWASNVDFGTADNSSIEIDLYTGYANEIAGFSYDLGYAQYTFPGETKGSNFGEAALTLGYDFELAAVSAKYYLGVQTDDTDPGDGWELGLSVPLPMEISLDGTYGNYDNKGTQNKGAATSVAVNEWGNYYSVGLSKSFGKVDFTLAYTEMNYKDTAANGRNGKDEDNVVFTIGTSF